MTVTAETLPNVSIDDQVGNPPAKFDFLAHLHLWRAAPVGLHLPFPDLLDGHHLVQGRQGRHEGRHHPLARLRARTGRAGARSASPRTRSARTSTCATSSCRFLNSVITSVSASLLAVLIGSLAAYGLSRFAYKIGWMRNKDISFFFLSQLILPPVVLALPFLVLYQRARAA